MDAFINLPQITKVWTGCIVLATLAAQFKTISPLKLMFSPEKAFSSQPWRLFTSFCYYGDILIPILLAIVSNIRWSKTLEEGYSVPMALFPPTVAQFSQSQHQALQRAVVRHRSADYWYYLFLMAGSIIALTSVGYYHLNYSIPMSGYVLHEVLTYTAVKRDPTMEVAIFGLFNLRGLQIPLMSYVFEWMTSPQFSYQFQDLLRGRVAVVGEVARSALGWKMFVCLFLGHFWWFIYDEVFGNYYHDWDEARRAGRARNRARRAQMGGFGAVDWTRRGLLVVLLPPWYWVIIHRLARAGG